VEVLIMKKFEVKYYIANTDMWAGEQPYNNMAEYEYTQADNITEAIANIMDSFFEQCLYNGYRPEIIDGGNTLKIYDTTVNQTYYYYNFTAEEA
jgi:hypothetical protein